MDIRWLQVDATGRESMLLLLITSIVIATAVGGVRMNRKKRGTG